MRRVPSFRHQVLVEMFRNCGELAPELLRRCAGIELDHCRTEIGAADLSQVESPDYRADSVVVLHGEDRAIRSAIIVEIQLGIDRTKLRSWPVYVTTVRARLDCPTLLLVITNKPWVARWARRPIDTGHPGFILVPVVVGFHDLPRIIDPREGRKLPELAVLSAMAHRDLDVAGVAIATISGLPEDRKRLYLTAILTELPFELRWILEDRMKRELVERYFERKSFAQGRSAGRSEGLRAAVLVLARARLDSLTTADSAAIAALWDESALSALIGALDGTRNKREARAAIRAAVASAG